MTTSRYVVISSCQVRLLSLGLDSTGQRYSLILDTISFRAKLNADVRLARPPRSLVFAPAPKAFDAVCRVNVARLALQRAPLRFGTASAQTVTSDAARTSTKLDSFSTIRLPKYTTQPAVAGTRSAQLQLSPIFCVVSYGRAESRTWREKRCQKPLMR